MHQISIEKVQGHGSEEEICCCQEGKAKGIPPETLIRCFGVFDFGVILWCFGVISHSSMEQNISPSLFSECYGVHGVIMFLVLFVVFQYSGVFSWIFMMWGFET